MPETAPVLPGADGKSWLDRALSLFTDVRAGEGATAALLRTLGQTVARTQPPERVTIPVSALTLFRSRLTPAGAVYTPLTKIALGGN